MRFDLMHVLSNRGRKRPWGELLDDSRRRAELGDELGFTGLWLGEHHFDAEGSDQLPNPVMLLADLAARTSRMRLGIAAIGLPLWHPIRLAEDLAMLDHFSRGRVDVAFSRGILRGEIVNLNPEADRRDEQKSRAIFAENLEIVKRAWTQDPFRWHGERYRIPWPETSWGGDALKDYEDENGHLTGLPIIPQPVQKPMPPLYAVSQQTEGFRLAARQGMGVISSHPAGKKLRALNEAYDEEAAKVGRPGHVSKVAPAVREFFVAESEQEARKEIEEFVNGRFEVIKRVRGLGAWLDVDEDPEDPKLQAMTGFDLMMERDYLFVGTPDSVAERMVRLHDEEGWDHFMLGLGHAPAEALDRSMRLMAEEVIPRVRRATGNEAELRAGGSAQS
ncbi:LLM class flavin-dependent oxidoreductase [Streptomyces viridiviolaceus]|uniref:LLM class flavin-dependent oxidoreductase n=1 Tax=Streptomyces viridiviolaceus TaxID=68282 RepID=A0ABW2E3D6_9ACTN|nr:LLM class flavin-dependent oxidoreductase [Streptomyces viridiviolaceus]